MRSEMSAARLFLAPLELASIVKFYYIDSTISLYIFFCQATDSLSRK